MEKKSVSASELSTRLEVSTKTIYRDIERLTMAGMPIYTTKGKGGGISLMDGFVMNKALFNEEEKLNILSAVQAFEEISPEKNNKPSRLNSFFGNTSSDWIEVDFSSWSSPKEERELFNRLKKSILAKTTVSFTYSNGKGEELERIVEPLKLGFKNQSWYLYGFCRTRNAPRFFKLIRIRNLKPNTEIFNRTTPAEIFPKDNIFEEEYVTLKLKISKEASYRVHEELPISEKQPDGSFIATINYPRGFWLFSYISSFGEHCEILEPEDIKNEYIQLIKNILNIYS